VSAAEAELLAAGIGRDAPQVGDVAPDFALSDQDGKIHQLSEMLVQGPVVLLFIRGAWCPFSEIVLRSYERIARDLRRLGASMVAIAPSLPEMGRALVSRNRLSLPLLFDRDNQTARAWRVAFPLAAALRPLFERLGHPLPKMNGTESWELPASATFVIAPDGRIGAAHVDPRKSVRMEPAEVLAAVRAIPALQTVPA
jgi:peroxiredoxin